MLRINDDICLSESEIEETFIQASGPGGQKVNKTASAVQLRFDAVQSPVLDDAQRKRLRLFAGRRMTAGGVLVIKARRYRSQERNREDARARLVALIQKALVPATPRRKTKPPAAVKAVRLRHKRRRGLLKRGRDGVARDEE